MRVRFGAPTLIETADIEDCAQAIGNAPIQICIENCDGYTVAGLPQSIHWLKNISATSA